MDGRPQLTLSHSGRVEEVEKFPAYVAKQIGFENVDECPHLCKLASDYLMKSNGCEENIFDFFAHRPDAETLIAKFIEEVDKCILGYFAFHWNFATEVISQILSGEDEEPKRKLRNLVLEATRHQRFERVMKDLKVTRIFSTLVEEMKKIGLGHHEDEHQCTEVMVPVAHSDRSPVLLLMGGGMGAGKTTVRSSILKESFWLHAAANAVIVEADAFKETDVIYQAISSMGHHYDLIQTAELVHQSSLDAASSLLVTALNEGRDVILDGTLAWEPFVRQTIAMTRAVHRRRHRMGPGYNVAPDGTVTEEYWVPIEGDDSTGADSAQRKPYRIELVGVVCDAYIAVVRGIRRAIETGRGVRVKSQLLSHKRFANAFPGYCELVDHARLYSTNSFGSYTLIGWKEGNSSLLVEPREITCLEKVSKLNEAADCVHDLYPDGETKCGSRSVWEDVVMSPSRALVQQELCQAIKEIDPESPWSHLEC